MVCWRCSFDLIEMFGYRLKIYKELLCCSLKFKKTIEFVVYARTDLETKNVDASSFFCNISHHEIQFTAGYTLDIELIVNGWGTKSQRVRFFSIEQNTSERFLLFFNIDFFDRERVRWLDYNQKVLDWWPLFLNNRRQGEYAAKVITKSGGQKSWLHNALLKRCVLYETCRIDSFFSVQQQKKD